MGNGLRRKRYTALNMRRIRIVLLVVRVQIYSVELSIVR
jgi:hypothetical protein